MDAPVSSIPAAVAAALVASTPVYVCVVGQGGGILHLNPSLEAATGWTTAEVAGRTFWDVLVVAHEVAPARHCVEQALAHGRVDPQEGDWLDRHGGHRRVSLQLSLLRDDAGAITALVCVGFDVTAQRQAEARLRARARTDELTGLANRGGLAEVLGAVLDEPGVGCGVLFGDLDGFKAANDTHGHEVGDLLLQAAAGRIAQATGSRDVAARLGGDEFVVVCPDSPADRVARVQARVEAAFDEPFLTPHGLVHLGISVGTAVAAPGSTPQSLLAAADRHMYGVKGLRRAQREARVSTPVGALT